MVNTYDDTAYLDVSIHAPARGATLACQPEFPQSEYVSIHAPARGATDRESWEVPALDVSIHAPARGATLTVRSPDVHWCRFNPRTREGCDAIDDLEKDHPQVSIHAPARGATWSNVTYSFPVSVSIHAPARGATTVTPNPFIDIMFQSTHPRGVRLTQDEGVDIIRAVSIHAPARGATKLIKFSVYQNQVSIHAPARGATSSLYFISVQ